MHPTFLDDLPALVVIDLQQGIVDGPKAHPVEDVVARSVALAEAFRSRGLPVVLVNVAGGAPGGPTSTTATRTTKTTKTLTRRAGSSCCPNSAPSRVTCA
ncbi:isochorismatase family protein [Streptacidiphilus monticola]